MMITLKLLKIEYIKSWGYLQILNRNKNQPYGLPGRTGGEEVIGNIGTCLSIRCPIRKEKETIKTDVCGSASPKLKHIVIIGKFDDGKFRQVLINPQTQDVVLSAVIACERQIRVLETIIEGIDIELPP